MSRIIAGRWASRRLSAPSGDSTRPTTDRVRESVFALIASWWGRAGLPAEEHLAGLRFLDLYAGSGAVGLEAASRGAEVVWVEKDRAAARVIELNLRSLGAAGPVRVADVARFLARPPAGGGFDIVWLDPPYALSQADLCQVLALVARPGWLRDSGRLIVERSRHSHAVEFPQGFLSIGARHYGDTVIHHAEKGLE